MVTGPCLCGFTRDEIVSCKLFDKDGRCTAHIDDNGTRCGRRVNEHPSTLITTSTQGIDYLFICHYW